MIKILILVHFTVTIDMQKYQIYLNPGFDLNVIIFRHLERSCVWWGNESVVTIHLFMERHSTDSAVGAAVSMQFIRHNWRSSSKIRKLDLSLIYNVCLAKLVWTRQSHASSTEHCPVSWQWCCVAPCYPLDEAQLRSGCWISQSPSLTWHGPHGRVGLVRGEDYWL